MDFFGVTVDIWTLISLISCLTIVPIFVYLTYFWKSRVIILENLGKDEKVYTAIKTKYVYSDKDVIYWNNRGYFLVNPTFLMGTKRYYIFEKDNSTPLVLNEKTPINALKVKHIIRDNVISQLIRASYTPPIKWKDILIIVAVLIIAIILVYNLLPVLFPTPQPTPTTPIPTITPRGF